MKCRSFVIFLLCFSLALSWGQASGSDFTQKVLPALSLNETNSSLLWQIGSDAITTSITSFEKLGPWMQSAESWMMSVNDWMQRSNELSNKAWEISVKQEAITNAASSSFTSLETSSKSYAEGMTLLTTELRRQSLELWFWRIATLAGAGLSVYLATR